MNPIVIKALLVVLPKMQKIIRTFGIAATGQRKQEYPTGFRSIQPEVEVQSPDITVEILERAVEIIERLCPVLDMLKRNVEIEYSFKITQ